MTAKAAIVPISELPASATVVDVPVGRVEESPLNHRSNFGDLAEFEPGIKLPGLARPRPGGMSKDGCDIQLVYGHRRRRGALHWKHPTIPLVIKDMTDEEVLVAQLVEHIRTDPHPMDEARYYHDLHVTHNKPVEELATRIGRKIGYVYNRMKLLELPKSVQSMLSKDEISLAKALLVIHIPDGKRAEKAAEAIAREDVTLAQARQVIRQNYMLLLKDAPFDTKDAKLVPKAGACTNCAKNTSVQKDLFGDLDAKDALCTDAPCYNGKIGALIKLNYKTAVEQQRKVLSGDAAKPVFRTDYKGATVVEEQKYIDIDLQNFNEPGHPTYRKMLGNKVKELAVVAMSPDGTAIAEVLEKSKLAETFKAAGIKMKSPSKSAGTAQRSSKPSAAQTKKQNEAEARRTLMNKAYGVAYPKVVASLRKAKVSERDLVVILGILLCDLSGFSKALCKEYGVKHDSDANIAPAVFRNMEIGKAKRFLIESSLQEQPYIGSAYPAEFEQICQVLKIDMKAIEKEITDGAKKPAPVKVSPKAKAAKKGGKR